MQGDSQRLKGEFRARPMDWEDVALVDTDWFAAGLQDLGLPDDEIADGVSLLSSASIARTVIDYQIEDFKWKRRGARYLTTPEELEDLYTRQFSISQRVADWLRGRTVRVGEPVHSSLKIPIFVISAPDVRGCSTSFVTSRRLTRNLDCQVTVYGSGISKGSQGSCKAQCQFEVGDGNAKIVFISAELSVGEVSVLSKGKEIGQGAQILAIEFPDPEPAVTLVPRDAYPSPGRRVKTYPLAGDTTGDISNYGYEYSHSNTTGFSLKAEVFGASIGLKVDVTLERTIGLAYALKGGHDYPLHHLDEGQGITWGVPRGPE